METITTATGKQYETDYFVPMGDDAISFRVLGVNAATAATVFFNKTETVQLWHGEEYYANYTTVLAMIPEGKAFKIMLRKG